MIPVKKMVACSIGPSPNDGHAHGGDMDWLSKLVGAENFWMAILLIPIKTVRLQARPQNRTIVMHVVVA